MLMSLAFAACFMLAARDGDAAPDGGGQKPVRTVFLVANENQAGAARFLTAVPAAAVRNTKPVVIAVDPGQPWRPELVDFLSRYQPGEIWTIGAIAPEPPNLPCDPRAIEATSNEALARELARRFFSKPSKVVLCTFSDRTAALEAAVLAGRLGLPLLPCGATGLSEEVAATLRQLDVRRCIAVGADVPASMPGIAVERLGDAADVARCLERNGQKIEYIAAVNPEDGNAEHARDMSIAAALLAVGRRGAIAPTPTDVQWKRRVEAAQEVHEAPPGASPSASSWRRGVIENGTASLAFVAGIEPRTGQAYIQCDRNADGDFGDAGESPLMTSSEIEVGGRRFAIDLDAEENARGRAVWLTSPTATEVVGAIKRVRTAAAEPPATLCLVGWPQTLPLAIVGTAQPIDADLVSDVPLGQVDDDPFVDLAYARFIAEDACSATLQASRGLVSQDFPDRSYESYFATAEWSAPSQPVLESMGFTSRGHHPGAEMIASDSPLAHAGWILHASHSMWLALGETYAWDTTTLLAPCLVQSDGCSTAALDMDPEYRSAPARMLRNGALAFMGAARRNSAPGELFASEFTNAVLAGKSLGEAHRSALNRMITAVLARGEGDALIYKYQLGIASAYGDPALVLFPQRRGGPMAAAHLEVEGARASVVVNGPWYRTEYAPLAEWGCATPKIYTWRGLGVGAESIWSPQEKRNDDALVYTAEARTGQNVTAVEATDDAENRWGFDGKSYVDVHEDGTRSIYWRVKLIDFDMNTGEVRAQRDRAEFRLLSR